MLRKFFLLMTILCLPILSTSADDKTSSAGDIARKLIEDFHQALNDYNTKTPNEDLKIKKVPGKDIYSFKANKVAVEFSAVDYFSDRLRINGKLVSWTSVLNLKEKHHNEKKTTFTKFFSFNAHANYEELLDASDLNLSAGDTKVLVTALSNVTRGLEDIGVTCMFSCKQDRRKTNLAKLTASLNNQLADCEGQKEKQDTSIDKARRYKMTEMLYSTYDSEFKNVKKLVEYVAQTTNKQANGFFSDYLNHEDKNYNNCPSTIASMTVADHTLRGMKDQVALGSAAFGKTSVDIVNMKNESIKFCMKLQELRNCLSDVNDNVSVMNSIRREIKRTTGYETKPEPLLPSSSVLAK